MIFQITATIKHIGHTESFGSKGFQKRLLVLEDTSGQYSDHYPLDLTRDNVNLPEQLHLQPGTRVNASFAIRGNHHEPSNRWFTSLNVTKLELAQHPNAPTNVAHSYTPPPQQPTPPPPQQQPQPRFTEDNHGHNYDDEEIAF